MTDPRMSSEGDHTASAVDPRMTLDEWRIWDLEGEVEGGERRIAELELALTDALHGMERMILHIKKLRDFFEFNQFILRARKALA